MFFFATELPHLRVTDICFRTPGLVTVPSGQLINKMLFRTYILFLIFRFKLQTLNNRTSLWKLLNFVSFIHLFDILAALRFRSNGISYE